MVPSHFCEVRGMGVSAGGVASYGRPLVRSTHAHERKNFTIPNVRTQNGAATRTAVKRKAKVVHGTGCGSSR